MKIKCYLSHIDKDYDPKKDLALGPWCFNDTGQVREFNAFKPYSDLDLKKKNHFLLTC